MGAPQPLAQSLCIQDRYGSDRPHLHDGELDERAQAQLQGVREARVCALQSATVNAGANGRGRRPPVSTRLSTPCGALESGFIEPQARTQ
jgi:hypothetical protein